MRVVCQRVAAHLRHGAAVRGFERWAAVVETLRVCRRGMSQLMARTDLGARVAVLTWACCRVRGAVGCRLDDVWGVRSGRVALGGVGGRRRGAERAV